MKNIKEYINESLFDDEDDLLDRKTSQEALIWLKDPNNAILNPLTLKNIAINNNGEVYTKEKYGVLSIRLLKPLPDWIKFDKTLIESNKLVFELNYHIKFQKDVPSVGIICGTSGDLKNISLNIHRNAFAGYAFFDQCNSIKNLLLIAPEKSNIVIELMYSKILFKDLAEIRALNNTVIISVAHPNNNTLRNLLIKIIKDPQYIKNIEKEQQLYLQKMYDNGVTQLLYTPKFILKLKKDGDKISLHKQVIPQFLKAYI